MRRTTWLILITALLTALAMPAAKPARAAASWTPLAFISPQTIIVDPHNPSQLYVGFEGQGKLPQRSVNGGVIWQTMATNQASTFGLAAAPTQPMTLYSGEADGRPRLARSADGGTSWAAADGNLPNGGVRSMAVDPTNAQRVYFSDANGALYRTSNGGASWAATTLAVGGSCDALGLSSANPLRIYVGCNTGANKSIGSIRTSSDGGVTWSPSRLLPGSPRLERLIASPINPDLVYATTTLGVYRSSDGGLSWGATNQGMPAGAAIKALAIDSQNPTVLYAGIYPPMGYTGLARIYRSANSGTTWTFFGEIGGPFVEAIAVDPTSSTTIYVSTSYAFYRYSDPSVPTIAEQPLNQRIRPGKSVTLDVVVGSGSAPFSYQWYEGPSGDTSRPVVGATARSFTTPVLSADTAYWVRVSNSVGSIDSRTAAINIKGAYNPTLDGFNSGGNFQNFSYTPGDAIPGASWEIFKRTFSANSMELPDGRPRQGAKSYFLSPAYRGVGAGGDCFGMSAVSMLRYLDSNDTAEQATLNPYYRRFTQIADLPPIVSGAVTVGKSNVKDYIFLYQGRQQSVQIQAWLSRHTPDTPVDTFNAIKQITQAGNVALLVFWYQYPNGQWSGHAVVAYGTQQVGNAGKIAIYDPNWPGDTTRQLSVDLGLNTWQYELWAGTTWSGNADLKYVPLSMLFPAFVSLPQAGAASLLANESGITLGIEGNADLLITDSQGHRFGPSAIDPTQEISGALRLVNFSFNPDQPNATSPEAYYLPAGKTYTVTVQPAAGLQATLAAATEPYTLTAFGDGSAMTLGGTSLSGGQSDSLVIQGTPRATTFTPATDGSYCQALTDEVSAENSREYRACVAGGDGVPASFAIGTNGAYSVKNAGAKAINTTVLTTQVGSLTGDGAITTTLAPGAQAVAPPPLTHVYLPLIRR